MDWEGRRIDVSEGLIEHEHGRIAVLTHRVFRSPKPHLVSPTSERVLADGDEDTEETVLNITLLWEELLERAADSHTAVLGLIDIASLRGNSRAWSALEAVVRKSVASVAASMDPNSAWEYLAKLYVRLEATTVGGTIDVGIEKAAARLTMRDLNAALMFLRSALDPNEGERRHSRELFDAVVKSVSASDRQRLALALTSVSPLELIRLAFLDDAIMAALFSAADPEIDRRLKRFAVDGLRVLDAGRFRSERFRLLRHIHGDSDADLLREAISSANARELVEAVNLVWSESGHRTRRLGEEFCAAAITSGSRSEVRAEFARLGNDLQTDRCIDALLVGDPADVRWLMEDQSVGLRRPELLRRLVERMSTEDLERSFKSQEMVTKALDRFSSDLRHFAVAAVRVVGLSGTRVCNHFALFLNIYEVLEGEARGRIAQSLWLCVLVDPMVQGAFGTEHVLDRLIDDITLGPLIDVSLDGAKTGEEVSRALVVLGRSSPALRSRLESHRRQVVRLVAGRVVFDLNSAGVMALLSLIHSARGVGHNEYVELCSMILPYAISARGDPACEIVKVAFPVVYDELRRGRDSIWLATLFDFFDWDRCKVARKDLVRAFMRSEWPPIDLAVTALRSKDLRTILKRVAKEKGGARYLSKIYEGARDLEEATGLRIQRAVRSLRER